MTPELEQHIALARTIGDHFDPKAQVMHRGDGRWTIYASIGSNGLWLSITVDKRLQCPLVVIKSEYYDRLWFHTRSAYDAIHQITQYVNAQKGG